MTGPGYWLLVFVETVLMAAMWTVAISGFWNGPFLWTGLATGLVACLLTLAVSSIIALAMLEVRR